MISINDKRALSISTSFILKKKRMNKTLSFYYNKGFSSIVYSLLKCRH